MKSCWVRTTTSIHLESRFLVNVTILTVCVCVTAEGSLCSSGLPGAGGESTCSPATASVSKKAKKEVPDESSCSSPETESELPKEDTSKYPEGLGDKAMGEMLETQSGMCAPVVKPTHHMTANSLHAKSELSWKSN